MMYGGGYLGSKVLEGGRAGTKEWNEDATSDFSGSSVEVEAKVVHSWKRPSGLNALNREESSSKETSRRGGVAVLAEVSRKTVVMMSRRLGEEATCISNSDVLRSSGNSDRARRLASSELV